MNKTGPGTVCSLPGCTREVRSRGLCAACYKRLTERGELPRLPVVPPADRFWARVDKNGPLPTWAPFLGPCWLWTGPIEDGYGRLKYPNGKGKWILRSHVVSYNLEYGPVPEGLEIDHLCRVRHCARPSHLEAVTHAENGRRGNGIAARNARKATCRRGHPFDKVGKTKRGTERRCSRCDREYLADYYRKNRSKWA